MSQVDVMIETTLSAMEEKYCVTGAGLVELRKVMYQLAGAATDLEQRNEKLGQDLEQRTAELETALVCVAIASGQPVMDILYPPEIGAALTPMETPDDASAQD